MESLSLQEFFVWVELLNLKRKLITPNASNLIFLAYLVVYFFDKRLCFIAAFFVCEVFGAVYIHDNPVDIFVGYSLIYCALYWWLYFCGKHQLKTIACCATMYLFELGMALDATYYPETETFIYVHYVHITMLIHLLIICSLFRWSHIRRGVGDHLRAFSSIFHIDDGVSFLWYNLKNTQTKNI